MANRYIFKMQISYSKKMIFQNEKLENNCNKEIKLYLD